jgi:hypothetical protein
MLIVFLFSYIVLASAKWTNNIFYALIALPGFFILIKEHGAGLFRQPLSWAWLVFLLYFLVPAQAAGDMQFYKHIAYVGLFIFIVGGLVDPAFFRSGSFVRSLFWVIALYIFICSIYGWMSGQFIFGRRVGLLLGRMDNVIYASIWLFCALALALPTWQRERRWVEGGCAVLLSLIAVTFVLQTRTALVGAAFLLGVWALYSIYRFPKAGIVSLLAFVVLLGLVVWIVKDESWYLSLWTRGDSYRIELFQIMTGEWQRCGWLQGCGIGFKTAQTLAGGMPIQHPHNIFVSLGVFTGAVALVLFVAIMLATLIKAWRMGNAWGLYLACALVMLNFDGTMLIGNPDELWVLVLLPAAMILAQAVERGR